MAPDGRDGLVEATLLFTDIEGSTRLWEEHPTTMPAALERHFEILRAAVAEHDGRIVDEAGDGVFGAFQSAASAAAAAVTAQRALHATTWPTGAPLRVRMGLHTGAVVPQGPALTGTQVHRCARLAETAHGGQVVLSSATTSLLAGALPTGTTTRSLGEHRLRDLNDAEVVHQLVTEGLPADFPPLRSMGPASGNLPEPLSGYIEREQQQAALHAALDAHRLVTLVGAGGIGKTRLALRVARQRTDRHAGGVWLTELATVTSPDDVIGELMGTLDLATPAGVDAREQLRQRIAAVPVLLVLDNCEHVIEAVAELADDLLRAAPDLTILATSREPLGVDGEVVRRVPSLSVDGGVDSEARRLFIDRARAADPTWEPAAEDDDDIAAVCRRLDGLPLAIELAAARIRVLTPAELRDRLDSSFALLASGNRSALPRQRTLEGTVAWSYGLLEEPHQRALAALSIFVSSFDLDGAEAVVAAVTDLPAIDVVAALVDKSLLQQVRRGRATQYRMLETVRFYARERLAELGMHDAVARAHLAWAVDVAGQADAVIVGSASGSAASTDLHVPDLRAAIQFAEQTLEVDAGLRLITELHQFVHLGSHHEPLAWVTRFIGLAEEHGADPVLLSRAHSSLSEVLSFSHDVEGAVREARRSIELLEGIDDPLAEGWARHNLAMALWVGGDHRTARDEVERVLPLFERAGNFPGTGRSLYELALWEIAHGDPEAAEPYKRRMGQLPSPDHVSPMAAVHVREIDALLALQRDDVPAARIALAKAVDIQRELAYAQCVAHLVDHVALAAAKDGDHVAAARMLGAARAVRQHHIGTDVQPFEQVFHDAVIELAEPALGEDTFTHWLTTEDGHTMLSALELAADHLAAHRALPDTST